MADHRTSPLKKSDLQFTYPTGASGDDNPALRGTPDDDLLNRSEWYEMLYFVNKFANECGKGSESIAKKSERLIQCYVPRELHSQAKIRRWLLDHWKDHGTAPII